MRRLTLAAIAQRLQAVEDRIGDATVRNVYREPTSVRVIPATAERALLELRLDVELAAFEDRQPPARPTIVVVPERKFA